jgi:hypothetical protein
MTSSSRVFGNCWTKDAKLRDTLTSMLSQNGSSDEGCVFWMSPEFRLDWSAAVDKTSARRTSWDTLLSL